MMKKLVVGLGNPGGKYAHTRHNFGARAVQELVRQLGEAQLTEQEVAFLLPVVNMNQSGIAVAEFAQYHNLLPAQILIIHDELELPLGEFKFQEGGGARGHKGVRSVHEKLGTQDVPRLRLGIGRPDFAKATSGEANLTISDYVLGEFTLEEELVVEKVVAQAVAWLTEYLTPRPDQE